MDEKETRWISPTGQSKESQLTSQLVIYRTEILMVGITDVNLHPIRTRNALWPDCANGLGTRGGEINGSMAELTAIVTLPEIGNCSGAAGCYIGGKLEVKRARAGEEMRDRSQIDTRHGKRL